MTQREIKFRAWDIEESEMYYNIQDNTLLKAPFITGTNYFNYFLKHGGFVVMQFTGLKDKNGKEIYEGDIVHWKTKYLDEYHAVIWGDFGWWLTPRKGEDTFCGISTSEWEELEVIGNIYENPELLK